MDRNPERVLDELLVMSAKAGSPNALRALVVRWTPRLRRHAERLLLDAELAADAVQDSWLAIAGGLARLNDPARFSAWAFSIVSRKCADTIRRRTRDRRLEREVNGAAVAAASRDDGLDVAAAVGRLPAEQRMMVSLFYGEGLSVEEIARSHGLAAGTVKSRLFAARRTLKAFLTGDRDDPY